MRRAEPLDRPNASHQMGLGELVDPALNRRRVQVAAREGAGSAGRVSYRNHNGAAMAVGEANTCLNQRLDGFHPVRRGLLEVERLALQAARRSAAVYSCEHLVEVVG